MAYPSRAATQSTTFKECEGLHSPLVSGKPPSLSWRQGGRRRRNNCCAEITLLRKGRPMQFPAVCAKGKGEEGFLVFVLFFLLRRFERKLSGFFVVASLCPLPPTLPFSLHSTSAEDCRCCRLARRRKRGKGYQYRFIQQSQEKVFKSFFFK